MPHQPSPHGTSAELDCLVDAYSDLVLRVCYSRLGSLHDAHDACQTVFLKFVQRMSNDPTPFADAEHEKAWFIRCAINTCIDMQRDRWSSRVVPLEEAIQTPQPPTAEPSAAAEQAERHNRVFCALQELSPAQRQAVYLHYYESYPVKTIAQLTGETPNTVSQHLSRARSKLRDILKGETQ